jgi:hypothetical protein
MDPLLWTAFELTGFPSMALFAVFLLRQLGKVSRVTNENGVFVGKL